MFKKRLFWLTALASLALLLTSAPALAQEVAAAFDVGWWTVDNGGGSSAGGIFSVAGTIGQPDAGTLTGGDYAMGGGFWDTAADLQIPWGGHIYLPVTLQGRCSSSATEREPNNLVNQANWLCLDRPVTGSHDGATGTGDLFAFDTQAGDTFQLTLNTSSSTGVQLLLYLWEDDSLVLLEQDATEPFVISYSTAQGKRYYAYVFSDPNIGNSAIYTLQVTLGVLALADEEQSDVLSTPPPLPAIEP